MSETPAPEAPAAATAEPAAPAAVYAIVEVFGHRKLVGRIEERLFCGQRFLAVTVAGDPPFEQLVNPSSIFALTPCSAEQARAGARRSDRPYELEPPRTFETPPGGDDFGERTGPCPHCQALAGEPCHDDCHGGDG